MEYTLDEKNNLIKEELLKSNSKNPIKIAKCIMDMDFINIHGPEHHFLDGASFLCAYKNSGANIDLSEALDKLAKRTINMPGAMCGYFGVCGAVTSLGAVLSIIHDVTPLTSNKYYKDNMEFTSLVISKMSKIGGPRCCKRNAFISLKTAIEFVKEKYNINIEVEDIVCNYSMFNKQCINKICPFYKD